jgi:hypothetical protein
MKGGDKLPDYGEFVVYYFNGRTLVGVSAGATDPDAGEILVYIPENDNFETKKFDTEVFPLNSADRLKFAAKIREIKLSNAFTTRFPSIASGGRTRKRKNKNKRTYKSKK